jgi:ferritin-like metal-binding protein YciE
VSITNPQEKFTHELCLTYDAEHQFLEAQQQMLGQVLRRGASGHDPDAH